MTRIAWISPSPTLPTGLGKVARKLTQGLREAGYEVVIGNPQYSGQPIMLDGMTHFPLSDESNIKTFLQYTSPDLVIGYYSHWIPPYSKISETCEELGLRFMQYITAEFSTVSLYWLLPLAPANFLAVTSEFGKRLLLKHNVPESKIKVVYHGVDLSRFQPLSPRPRFQGYEDMFFFGFVARNNIRKGFPHIMRAFARLPAEIKGRSMLYLHTTKSEENVFLGGTARGWDLPLLAVKYNLQGKILLPDDRASKWWGVGEEELGRIYNAIDVYVHASTGEGFGLPLLEAMACGLPVIASNNTAVPEVVGDAGILTPCYEEEDETLDGFTLSTPKIGPITEAMIELFLNPNLKERLSKRARERAAGFTWHKAIVAFCEAVGQALKQERVGKEILRASEPIDAEGVWGAHAQLIPKGNGRCLDVGSGPNAFWRRIIEEKGYEYIALDCQPGKVDVLARVPPLPFRDKSFSLVFSRNLLEHLPTERQVEFIEECKRVGKRALIIFTTQKSLHFYIDPGHREIDERVYTMGEYTEIDGCGVIRYEG